MSRQKPHTFLQTFFEDFFWPRVGPLTTPGFTPFREEFFEGDGGKPSHQPPAVELSGRDGQTEVTQSGL
jgi:hypothetical protein